MTDLSINRALIAATVGLLTWNVWTTSQLSISVAVLTEKVTRIEQSLKDS